MREFNLVSVDWDTVRLMQAGQFKQETRYLEELVRWSLQRGRLYGLMHLEDKGLSHPTPEGERSYSVTLRGCFGVGALGNIIDIPDDPGTVVAGIIEARAATVPLYVGVSILGRNREAELYPSSDIGLLQCGGRRRLYKLASDDTDDTMDWLQIAQFQKTPAGLAEDMDYIPECIFLNSHGGQWGKQQEIQALAQQALGCLQSNSTANVGVYAAAAALAGSLGPAARVLEGKINPRLYIDRLAGIFVAQRTQLQTLPNPNLAIYQQTLDQLRDTLDYFDTDWTMGQAFVMARECFERLCKLYPALLAKLNEVQAAIPRRELDHGTVVPATRQADPATSYQPNRAVEEPPPVKKSPIIWRR